MEGQNLIIMARAKPKVGAKDPIGHHYVSSFYLSRFADSAGFLDVHDKHSGKSFRTRPKEAMKQSHYYRQEWAPSGIDPNIFEKTLGQWLENDAPIAMDHLVLLPAKLTEHDATTLVLFLELQRIKVPRQASRAEEYIKDWLIRSVPHDIVAELQSGKVQFRMTKSGRFEYMRTLVGAFTHWFASMEWEVVVAEEGAGFITTDSPVSFFNIACLPPAEAGIALAGTRVLFPLDSIHLLIMRHREYRNGTGFNPLRVLPEPLRCDRTLTVISGAVWPRSKVQNHNLMMKALADRFIVGKASADKMTQ